MPEHRTSARLKNKKTTITSTATQPDPSSNSLASSRKNPPKRRKIVASPAPNVVEDKPVKRKTRGIRGKLKLITEMPVDILYETFSHLQPADLLHLSWASKSLYNILLNRRAQFIWKTSFANIEANPPPEMPPDMIYPNYALLLFGTQCRNCCKAPGPYVHWAARLRFCLACIDEKTIPTTDPIARGLWRICPTWSLKLPKGGRRSLYLKEDCERIVQEKDRLKDDKILLAEFTEAQITLCLERYKHAQLCFFWIRGLKTKRKNDLQSLRSKRLEAICERLRGEGWGPELDFLGPRRTLNLPGADKAQALTDRIWSNIRPEVVDFIEEIRVIRLEKERKDLIQIRMMSLHPMYEGYLKTQPRCSPLPGFPDICAAEPFQSLIFSTPADQEFTLPGLAELESDFAAACKAWVESRSRMLEALLPPEYPRLDVAATFFRCQWCKEPISYPRILKHACLIIPHANFEPNGDNMESYDYAIQSERPWNFGGHQVEFDEEAAGYAREIIGVCGADPREVTPEAMNKLDRRVECLRCSQAKRKERLTMRWSTAIIHEIENHHEEEWEGPRWKLLEDPSEIALVREKEQASKNNMWGWIGCNHCGRTINAGTLVWHLRTSHDISNITSAEALNHTFIPLDQPMNNAPHAIKLPRVNTV